MKNRIYLSPPYLDGHERDLLLQAFNSNWITTLGPHVEAFEQEVCVKTGIRYSAALSSGTAALHLTLLMLGVSPGDKVICSDLTFVASANAITYLGATPIFVDSDRATWNICPELLLEELESCSGANKLPKAAIVVDLYGQCADYVKILEICRRYGVAVVEDAAEALGATYRGNAAGKSGIMGVFSFNGNKIITTSGGGMLVSDNEEFIERAKYFSTQARDPAPHYQHSQIGYNYRLSNILAAIGRGQLARLDAKIARRKQINSFYKHNLADLPGIEFMPIVEYGKPNYWLTVVLITPVLFGADREAVRQALEAENIESRPIWKPMHMQPVFAGCRIRGGAVSEDLFARGLCLPSGNQMTEEDLERVVAIIRNCYKKSQVRHNQL